VTAEQSLVGAMRCASWRSHYLLREHANLVPVARLVQVTYRCGSHGRMPCM
jgi:hypothetical protein